MAECRLALPGCGSPGFLWSWGRSGQAGCGIAAILVKTATMALAQGHVFGMRRLAARLASTAAVDVHALLQLVDRGCPPELAARILSPITTSGEAP